MRIAAVLWGPFEEEVRGDVERPGTRLVSQLQATVAQDGLQRLESNDYAEVSPKGPGKIEGKGLEVPQIRIPKANIPVGGRLCHFLKEWEEITSDKWVLEII